MVGKVKDRALAGKLEQYLKRIRFEAGIEIVSVRDSGRVNEGSRLIRLLDQYKRARVYALAEEGKPYTSAAFAAELDESARDIVFVIGGPDGLADTVKARADTTLSLSRMTFPHEMAAVILVEQIFRALTILGGRSYHR